MKRSSYLKQNFDSIDVAKFLCALLIIMIHTAPLAPYSALGNFYLCNVLARVAVPLFFAFSGFLFSLKPSMKKQTIRIGKLYLIWSAVYLIIQIPEWHRNGWWGFYVIKDYFVALVMQGSYYHLWYLLATLYALPLLYVFIKYGSRYLMVGACGLLWLLECLTYSYTWIGIGT